MEKDKIKRVEFYYGEYDWTENLAAKKLHDKYEKIQCEIIPKATHNMIFDFPH